MKDDLFLATRREQKIEILEGGRVDEDMNALVALFNHIKDGNLIAVKQAVYTQNILLNSEFQNWFEIIPNELPSENNAKIYFQNVTPLHIAAYFRQQEIMIFLMTSGANFFAQALPFDENDKVFCSKQLPYQFITLGDDSAEAANFFNYVLAEAFRLGILNSQHIELSPATEERGATHKIQIKQPRAANNRKRARVDVTHIIYFNLREMAFSYYIVKQERYLQGVGEDLSGVDNLFGVMLSHYAGPFDKYEEDKLFYIAYGSTLVDSRNAITVINKAAELKDPENPEVFLGKRCDPGVGMFSINYRLGMVHKADNGLEAAFRYFKESYEKEAKNALAGYELALCFLNGKGVKQDSAEARRILMDIAADHMSSRNTLVTLCENWKTDKFHKASVIDCLSKLLIYPEQVERCKQILLNEDFKDFAPALIALGDYYLTVNQSERAKEYYESAMRHEAPAAARKLANLYNNSALTISAAEEPKKNEEKAEKPSESNKSVEYLSCAIRWSSLLKDKDEAMKTIYKDCRSLLKSKALAGDGHAIACYIAGSNNGYIHNGPIDSLFGNYSNIKNQFATLEKKPDFSDATEFARKLFPVKRKNSLAGNDSGFFMGTQKSKTEALGKEQSVATEMAVVESLSSSGLS